MSRPAAISTIRRRIQDLSPDDDRAALDEARRRFAEAKQALAEGADQLSDSAEDAWEDARKAAAPKLKSWRRSAERAKKRASKAIGEFDAEGLRKEAKHLSADVGHRLLEFGADVTEATRHEADRIIAQIHEAAEESRREAEAARKLAEDAERKRRVRALVGWTAFGLVAGAVLSNAVGRPKGQESAELEVAGLDDLQGGPVEPDGTADTSETDVVGAGSDKA